MSYAIADPFLRFWFRFVAPRESRLHTREQADKLEVIREELGAPRARLYFFDRAGFSARLMELAAERDDVELVLASDLG